MVLTPLRLRLLHRNREGGGRRYFKAEEGQPHRYAAFAIAADNGVLGANLALTRDRQALIVLNDPEVVIGYAWPDPIADGQSLISNFAPDLDVLRPGRGREWLGYGFQCNTDGNTESVLAGDHIVTFDLEHGGMIVGWAYQGVEMVNTGSGKTRGIQAGMFWTDPKQGRFRKFSARQGGDRFTEVSESNMFFGGQVTAPLEVENLSDGSVRITTRSIPVEYDPDGRYGVPGLEGGFGGGLGEPVLLFGIELRQTLHLNVGGVANVHRLTSEWTIPEGVDSAYFPMEAYHVLCLDESLFPRLRAYDRDSQTDSELASGTVGGPGYQEEYRTYVMDRNDIYGDDEAASVGPSVVPSGDGGIAAVGATDDDLAVYVGGELTSDDVTSTAKVLNDYPSGNGWRWAQHRAATGGPSGENLVALGHGAFLVGRLHPYLSKRSMRKGTVTTDSILITDTWTNVKQKADGLA